MKRRRSQRSSWDSSAGENSEQERDPAFIRSVVKVQRAYRLNSYVYRHFGPELFVDSKGISSSGRVKFEGVPDPARWINVAQSTSVRRVSRFMAHHWEMQKPEVLITVTGGAQQFHLKPQLQVAFDRGLVSAAQAAKAWIITSGSDSGVMRLVGDAMHRSQVPIPVVGILPWGVVNKREELTALCKLFELTGKHASYKSSQCTSEGVAINSGHTHFIFVDNGHVGSKAWGSEIAFRSALEAEMARTKNVPLVQLVVQGGPGTLATVESIALAGKPIVVLSDSGGAATAVHQYCAGGINAVVEPAFHKMEAKLHTIKSLNDAYGGKQLTFFSLEDCSVSGVDHPELSSSLLEAIVQMHGASAIVEALSADLKVGTSIRHPKEGLGQIVQILPDGRRLVRFWENDKRNEECYAPQLLHHMIVDSSDSPYALRTDSFSTESQSQRSKQNNAMARTLELTVVWDQPALTKKVLASLDTNDPDTMQEIDIAMTHAIELQREKVLEQFFELGRETFHRVDMLRLYTKPDKSKFLSSNRLLQERLRQMVYEKDVLKADHPHALYQRALSKFFRGVSPVLQQELKLCDHTRANDVFYWLILHGNEDMARDVWPKCDNPIHAVLLGVAICDKMADVAVHGKASAAERAQLMQEWAVGALDTATDEEQAHEVLLRSIHGDQFHSALDIALSVQAKAFLAQRHCLSLTARLWLQSTTEGPVIVLPDDIPYWRIFLYTILPFLNPLLWPKPRTSTRETDEKTSLDTEEASLGAARMAFAISAEERKHVHGDKSALVRQVMRIEQQAASRPRQPGKDDTTEGVTLSTMMRVFYSIPAVKFVWRLIFQLLLVCLYACFVYGAQPPAVYQDEGGGTVPDIDAIPFLHQGDLVEIAWLVVALCLLVDYRYRTMLHSISLSSGWERLFKFISDVLLVAAVAARLAMEVFFCNSNKSRAEEYYQSYILVVSFLMIFAVYELLPFLSQVCKPLGVLYIIFKKLLVDVSTWSLLFSIITFSFCFTLVGMQKAGYYVNDGELMVNGTYGKAGGGIATGEDGELTRDELLALSDPFDASGAMWAPLWAIFGDPSPENYSWLASILIWVYCLVGNIVLVNLLVAMFADSYTKIASQSEIEYFFLRSTHLYEYQNSVLSMPPVLNLPLILMDGLCRIRDWSPSRTVTRLSRFNSINRWPTAWPSMSPISPTRHRAIEKKGRSRAGLPMPLFGFDGKLLVDRFLRQVIEQEGDTVHALARSTNDQLEVGMQMRETAILQLGARLGGIEDKLEKLAAACNGAAFESKAFESKKPVFPDPSILPDQHAPSLLDGVDTATKFLSTIAPFSSSANSAVAAESSTMSITTQATAGEL